MIVFEGTASKWVGESRPVSLTEASAKAVSLPYQALLDPRTSSLQMNILLRIGSSLPALCGPVTDVCCGFECVTRFSFCVPFCTSGTLGL